MSDNVSNEIRSQNRPLYSLGAAIALVVLGIVALIFVPAQRNEQLVIIIGLVVTTVPSLLAAGYAERTARDVRNGVVEAKAAAGATTALHATGVVDVVNATQRGESTVASLAALSQLVGSDTHKRDALALLIQATIDSQKAKADAAGEGDHPPA